MENQTSPRSLDWRSPVSIIPGLNRMRVILTLIHPSLFVPDTQEDADRREREDKKQAHHAQHYVEFFTT